MAKIITSCSNRLPFHLLFNYSLCVGTVSAEVCVWVQYVPNKQNWLAVSRIWTSQWKMKRSRYKYIYYGFQLFKCSSIVKVNHKRCPRSKMLRKQKSKVKLRIGKCLVENIGINTFYQYIYIHTKLWRKKSQKLLREIAIC